jgi:phosphatidate cytidylyltransferase
MSAKIIWTLGSIYTLLIAATITVQVIPARSRELVLRMRSWWMIVIAITLGTLGNRSGMITLWAFVSFLALKEYLSIIPTRRVDRRVLVFMYLAIPVQYLFVYYQDYGFFIILVPVYMLLILPMNMVLIGQTEGFLKAIGSLHWGLMVTVFCVGHLAYLVVLPQDLATGVALLLYLLIITQLNDVAQYIWGKRFGKHKVLPTVSPNKSVEGVVGGVLTTMLLSLVLGVLLTPMSWWFALAVGLLLAVCGFLGDVTISAIKRDLGIKDSSQLIPGHGGILDRIDSLTYTAPLFFHIIRYVFYLPGN